MTRYLHNLSQENGDYLTSNSDNTGALTISYSYDAYGRRTTMTYPSGYVLNFGFQGHDVK